jgi:aminoglycoside phosphotransferase
MEAGQGDTDDVDDSRDPAVLERDRLANRPADEGARVTRGDCSLPNVMLDPVTFALHGVVDPGCFGISDR